MKKEAKKPVRPAQHQANKPGVEWKMHPRPKFFDSLLHTEKKLAGKVAIITGGDSGIGRAVAINFAAHGAQVIVVYLNERKDAQETSDFIEKITGLHCHLIACDIGQQENCRKAVKEVIKKFKKIDVLVNNAGTQFPHESFTAIKKNELEKVFQTNVFSMFYMTQAVLPHMKKGATIINTASVTAYRGSSHLIDYSATKGAIVSFTRSLSTSLAEQGIRVNGVAPGPVWTPLIPSTFKAEDVKVFGSDVPLKRPGEPSEIAPCYVFLASDESSYMTGQFLHPNGGEIINT